jgi:hypothetical protein
MIAKSILIGSALLAATSWAVAAPKTHDTELDLLRGDKRLMVQTDATAVEYTSAAFTQVTAGTISVNTNHTGILLATFTAESQCTAVSWCSVRIVCDGVELQPLVGTDFAFNSPGGAAFKSLSVMRRSNLITGGSHTCEVQTAIVGTGAGRLHRLDDWVFTVEFWRQ